MFNLKNYLTPFNSICWYTTAGEDIGAVERFGLANEEIEYNLAHHDYPDCYIFTDYAFDRFEELPMRLKTEDEFSYVSENGDFCQIMHVKYYKKGLKIKPLFDVNTISTALKGGEKGYGDVYTFDMVVLRNDVEFVVKCVYIAVEALTFAINYLIPNKIYIKHLINYRTGGFGGRILDLDVLLLLGEDLRTEYLYTSYEIPSQQFSVNDLSLSGEVDILKYLTEKQKKHSVILIETDFRDKHGFDMYDLVGNIKPKRCKKRKIDPEAPEDLSEWLDEIFNSKTPF